MPPPIPFESEPNSLSRHDIIIAVMGATGSGKSSFINVASGKRGGTPGHGLRSCTQEVQAVRCPHPCNNVVFLDTPGFDDTSKTDFEVLENIATWLNTTYRQGINLTGLLFLQRISDHRMTGTLRRNTNMFSLLCGHDALQNVLLVTTMWNEVDETTGALREQELRESYWQAMIEGGCKMMRFDKTFESAWYIVAQLSGIRRPLRLQIEMIDKRKTLLQTAAGSAPFQRSTEPTKGIQGFIKQLQSRLRNTNSPEKVKEIEDQLAVEREKLEVVKEQNRMAQPYNKTIHITVSRAPTLCSTTSLPSFFTSSSPTSLPHRAELIEASPSPNIIPGYDQIPDEMAIMPIFKDILDLSVSLVESIEIVKDSKELPNNLAEDIHRFCKVVEEKAIGNTSDIGRALDYLYTEFINLDNLLKKTPPKGLVNTFVFQPANRGLLDDYNGRIRMACDAFVMRYTVLMSQELQESRSRREGLLAETTSSTEEDTAVSLDIPKPRPCQESFRVGTASSFDEDTATGPDIPDLTGEVFIIDPKPISGGGFSYVFRGHYLSVMVAIKVLIPVSNDLKTMNRKMRREREVWNTLSHPNVAPFYGYTQGDERAPLGSLISPWYSNGDTNIYLARHGDELDISKRKALLQGVVNGVSYLHTREPIIVHGDLKPTNVLIDDEGNPRLCDFGLARILLQEGSSGLNTTSEHLGTARYLAPELIPSDEVDEEEMYPTIASDIFAIGCTGLEIIFQQLPYKRFQHRHTIIRAIKRGDPPAARPIGTTPDKDTLWRILESCWGFKPEARPSAEALLASLETHESN